MYGLLTLLFVCMNLEKLSRRLALLLLYVLVIVHNYGRVAIPLES